MNKCKKAIDDFLKYGSNVQVNDQYVFNYGKHCGDYDNFKKSIDEIKYSNACNFVWRVMFDYGREFRV